jgi:hypothetical protein
MLTPFARQCARIVILAGILPLGLGACASDDSGVRALAETAALRTEMGQTRERQEGQARDIARIQSQLRGMETDTGERTREARAVGAELARARVLLEEARAALREQQAAAASVSAARAAAAPSLAVPPPAPSTPRRCASSRRLRRRCRPRAPRRRRPSRYRPPRRARPRPHRCRSSRCPSP